MNDARRVYDNMQGRNRRRHDIFIEVFDALVRDGKMVHIPDDRMESLVTRKEFCKLMRDVEPTVWGESKKPEDILRKYYWQGFIVWPGSTPEPWED